MNVITKNTQGGLADALEYGPKAEPTLLKATFLRDKDRNPVIRIENTGPNVTQLKISAVRTQKDEWAEIIHGFTTPRSGAGHWAMPTYALHNLDKGGQVDVEPVLLQQEHGSTFVGLEYLTDTGRRSSILEVRVTP
ncbi:hypothetical protein [Arthrobacter sp. MMS24-S77]